MPIIQIMGLSYHISSLNIADKDNYILQDIYSSNYLQILKQMKEGGFSDVMTVSTHRRCNFLKIDFLLISAGS
jgi:hypothetical protein